MEWTIAETRDWSTLIINQQLYIHSKYSPKKELENWIYNVELSQDIKKLYICSFGLGHHLKLLSDKFPHLELVVFEVNEAYFQWIQQQDIYFNVQKAVRFTYINLDELAREIYDVECELDRGEAEFVIYRPLLALFQDEDSLIKQRILALHMLQKTIRDQKHLLFENYEENRKINYPSIFSQKYFQNQNVIVIGAGPSLSKQYQALKEMKRQGFLLFAVGTALTPLINEGIVPDLTMITDPKAHVQDQVNKVATEDLALCFTLTASKEAVKVFNGKKFVCLQEDFDWETVELQKYPKLIQTGGSVATSLVDLAVKLGSTSVALIGMDLMHTYGQSHVKGTHLYSNNKKNLQPRNLTFYREWLERYALTQTIPLYNCTEGGALIKNWISIPFSSYLEKYKREK